MTDLELNVAIAAALGWQTWDHDGKWYMERPSTPGRIVASRVPDYIGHLRKRQELGEPLHEIFATE